ncbi:hypothetical protein [Clostridium sp.]|uniref:hypothetical protein n=1 Tax=Clostridium sp. TaxID=1506 RepID=UPI001A4DDBB6|nr:hypothetical protein [Clostridium sp.]MBK5242558.1 hypothetical protein [Clostridium sp.]
MRIVSWNCNGAFRKKYKAIKKLNCDIYEIQGKENKPTFFLYRKKERHFHIDCFFGEKEKINSLEIGEFDDWITLSDHMPVILDRIL